MLTTILQLIIVTELIAISYFVVRTLAMCWSYWFPPKVVDASKPLSQKSVEILTNLTEAPYVG
ncbi:MAG: hypothetical protein IJ419_07350 [Agathobacter sp.]|nr:hypothetical protein [Agathobacter sp.]